MKRATYSGGKRAISELLPAADTKFGHVTPKRGTRWLSIDELTRIGNEYETTIYRADPTSDGRSITVIRCDRDCGVREVILWGMDTLEPLMHFFEMIWNCEYFIDPINEDWRMFLKQQNITDERTLKRIDYVAFPTNIDTPQEAEVTYLFLNSKRQAGSTPRWAVCPLPLTCLGLTRRYRVGWHKEMSQSR